MTIPAVVLVLAVFTCMLALSRLGIPLGIALVIGGIALDFCGGHALAQVVVNLGESLSSGQLWLLVAVVAMIIEFGAFMTRPENTSGVLSVVSRWAGRHGRAWALMAIPAVLGTIPMPGGALFSAPFVQQVGGDLQLAADDTDAPSWKTSVNYWFRHIIEYWWPLYPGVIVATRLFELDTWRFAAGQFIFTPVAALVGYFFLIRPHMAQLSAEPVKTGQGASRIRFFAVLLFVVIASALVLPVAIHFLLPSIGDEKGKLAAVLSGLLVVAALIVHDDARRGQRLFMKALAKKASLNILLTVGGVMIFQALLQKSGLIAVACGEMREWGIPAVCAVAALPFLAGFVTGIAVGFVAVSFPLVVELMRGSGGELPVLATLALAFGFGHAGMMLSPVHTCILVTRDYFGASLFASMRRIIPCVLSMLAFCLVVHFVMQRLGL